MKNIIHQTDAERLQNSTQSSGETLREHSEKLDGINQSIKDLHETAKDNLTDLKEISSDKNIIRKLEEIKSPLLVANKLMKDISKKEYPKFPETKDFPTSMEMTLKGISMITIKGDKGEVGELGPEGQKGEKGESIIGPIGKTGIQGPRGKDGTSITGPRGEDGKDGKDGKNGNDGSPDTADEVVEKVNTSKKKIKQKQVEGLIESLEKAVGDTMNQRGWQNTGGGIPPVLLSSGVKISDFVTEINFSTNLTAVYSGSGRVTLTATGGGGTTYSETPTGLINGVNKTYTVAHTITTVVNFAINGQFIHPAEYSAVGTTITFVTALDASLSGTGFTIIYQ